MKKPMKDRVGDFMAGKGFYIVLFLCVAAIGISGYYLFSSMGNQSNGPDAAVAGSARVTVASTPTPTHAPTSPQEKPAVSAKPSIRPAVPTAKPAPTPAAVQTPNSPPPVTTSAVFTWPVKGEVIGAFSMDALTYDHTMADWRTHGGIDIASDQGTQVLADAGGTVTDVMQDDLMGTTVIIDHGNGVISTLSNLAAVPSVEIGDIVSTGDIIGSVGATAIAESALPSHLHLEMTKDGLPTNPVDYLPGRS